MPLAGTGASHPKQFLHGKSPRIFRIEGCGIARIGFPRAGLTSVQLVELVDRLHAAGCPVPDIIPTSDGDLSIALGQKTLSGGTGTAR